MAHWVKAERSRTQAKLVAAALHPQSLVARVVRRRRGVTATVPVPATADEILERLSTLPVSSWTYGYDHDSVRHLGPMAQDFAAAFGLGDSDRRIDMVDANGVLIVACQALHRRVRELEDRLSALENRPRS